MHFHRFGEITANTTTKTVSPSSLWQLKNSERVKFVNLVLIYRGQFRMKFVGHSLLYKIDHNCFQCVTYR